MKLTNEQKLESLKSFLRENHIPFKVNYKSNTFGVKMAIKVLKLRIAVFLSDDDKEYEYGIVKMNGTLRGYTVSFCSLYNPFFIRKSETKAFVLEKMQNCIINRMLKLQKYANKKHKHEK